MGQNSYFSCKTPSRKKHFGTVFLLNASSAIADVCSRTLNSGSESDKSLVPIFLAIPTRFALRIRNTNAPIPAISGQITLFHEQAMFQKFVIFFLSESFLDTRVMFPPFFTRRKNIRHVKSICSPLNPSFSVSHSRYMHFQCTSLRSDV
jgi:hypothetical protein